MIATSHLGAKRKVYRCNSCGIDDQSDLCDGPIRQFEERARGRYAAMVANKTHSSPHSTSATVARIRQQTIEDAVHSGLSLNCKNIMKEYADLIHTSQVPGKTSFIGGSGFLDGDHPAITNSHGLCRFIDIDQEAEGGFDEGMSAEEEEEERLMKEEAKRYDVDDEWFERYGGKFYGMEEWEREEKEREEEEREEEEREEEEREDEEGKRSERQARQRRQDEEEIIDDEL